MKRGCKLALVLVVSVFIIGMANASVTLGNKSYEIETSYGPLEKIKGWVNISLFGESSNSLLTGFDSNITLKQFLDDNKADYSCFPGDCKEGYVKDGSAFTSKTFSINPSSDKIIGIVLRGNITGIDESIPLRFNISTNAQESCFNPLQIDVLADGTVDWMSNKIISDYSCYIAKPYGCYNEADYLEGNKFIIGAGDSYCNNISIPTHKGFKLGANIIKKSGSATSLFILSINTPSESKQCNVSTSSGGEIGCSIEFDKENSGFVQADVCIAASSLNGNEFEIKYEDIDPCGSGNGGRYDFPIFVNPRKYAAVSELNFTKDSLTEFSNLRGIIENYIRDKYNWNCNPECVIPIKFSGAVQDITIFGLESRYKIPGTKSETNIYFIKESNPVIDSDYQKLDLAKANIIVPSSFGNKSFSLMLNNTYLIRDKINIANVPQITAIVPLEVAVMTPYTFQVLTDKAGNYTYYWSFGDNSSVISIISCLIC
jgi:hypothetical protein